MSDLALDNLRIGILGAGAWGKNHVRVFSKLLGPEKVIVCDLDPERRSAMETAHPQIQVCNHLEYSDVDAIVIATPAASHFLLAKEALAANLDVLVEKPITLSACKAEELVEMAAKRKRILMVDHLLEYHPAVVRLKELIDEGRFGEILYASSDRLNLGVIRSEENALWSLSPHDISAILYLFDEEPSSVEANGASLLQEGIADVASIAMRFPSGRFAQVRASWLDPIKTRKLCVVGRKGMAVVDEMSEQKLVLHESRPRYQDGHWCVEDGPSCAMDLAATEPLVTMALAFLESISSRTLPRSDGQDGLRVVRVLEAASDSMGKHRP